MTTKNKYDLDRMATFIIRYYPQSRQIRMENCGPETSGHSQYGDRIYRRVTQSSRERLIRWIMRGHWVSTSKNWWLCHR